MKRSKPLERRKPLQATSGPKKGSRKRGLRQRSFSARFPADHDGPRYGSLFRGIRAMPCWLGMEGYSGPGHPNCGIGVQGGHTAHHVGRNDADGLLPCCGKAHDLAANIAGRRAQEHFSAWLAPRTLEEVGLEFIRQAMEEME